MNPEEIKARSPHGIKSQTIAGLKCDFLRADGSQKVAYMIYPDTQNYFPESWLQGLASKHKVSIVMVYIPLDRWDDMLTPWPEPGVPNGSQPFAGKSIETLHTLQEQIIPQCEAAMSIDGDIERDLIGVSLSGLFTLWQWITCDTFHSIACLSGSFWYNGFLEWFDKQPILRKTGSAYFLLGKQEPKAPVKAFQTVGVNTEAIYNRLKSAGIDTQFDWVPGGHISDPLPRAERAFDFLF